MKIKITISRVHLWIKAFLLIALTTLACSAFAEYYFVYPAPAVPLGCTGACYVHHYYHRCHHRHVHWVAHRYIRYIHVAVPACPCSSCCGGGVYQAPVANSYYYYNDDYDSYDPDSYYDYYYYDPDLATGDDDQVADPNMDIDY